MSAVYALVDAQNNIVGYVGQSNDPEYRFRQHIKEGWNCSNEDFGYYPITTNKARWLGYLLANKIPIEMRILEDGIEDRYIRLRENYWIVEMAKRGEPLTNGTLPYDDMEKQGIKPFSAYDDCPYMKARHNGT